MPARPDVRRRPFVQGFRCPPEPRLPAPERYPAPEYGAGLCGPWRFVGATIGAGQGARIHHKHHQIHLRFKTRPPAKDPTTQCIRGTCAQEEAYIVALDPTPHTSLRVCLKGIRHSRKKENDAGDGAGTGDRGGFTMPLSPCRFHHASASPDGTLHPGANAGRRAHTVVPARNLFPFRYGRGTVAPEQD